MISSSVPTDLTRWLSPRTIRHLMLTSGLFLCCAQDPAKPATANRADPSNTTTSPEMAAQGLVPGQTVDDFEALTQTGYIARLTQLIDKPLAVLFCSQLDNRCETMAQTVRDHWHELTREFEMVAMVTPSGWTETRSFSSRLRLPQLLLTDREGSIAQAFGLPGSQAKYHAYIVGQDRAILRSITDLDPSRIHSTLLSTSAAPSQRLP